MTSTLPLDSQEHRDALAARHDHPEGPHLCQRPVPPRIYDDVDTETPQPDLETLALMETALQNMLGRMTVGASPAGSPVALPSWIDFKLNVPIIMAVLGVGVTLIKQIDGIDARTSANAAAILEMQHSREINLPLLQGEVRRGDTQDFRLGAQSQALDRLGVQADALGRRVDGIGDKVSDLDKRQAVMEGRLPSLVHDR